MELLRLGAIQVHQFAKDRRGQALAGESEAADPAVGVELGRLDVGWIGPADGTERLDEQVGRLRRTALGLPEPRRLGQPGDVARRARRRAVLQTLPAFDRLNGTPQKGLADARVGRGGVGGAGDQVVGKIAAGRVEVEPPERHGPQEH